MGLIKNVIVLGASGNVGKPIVSALLQADFTVTVNSSTSSLSDNFFSKVAKVSVDYSSVPSLKEAFTRQDAIVEAFNPNVSVYQDNIVKAAVEAGVKHIITPDFSSDTFHAAAKELLIFEPKQKAQRLLEAETKNRGVRWTAIITGPFFDWAIPRGIFWVDPKTRTVTVFGSGNQKVSMSNIDIVGRATVAVLSNPDSFADRPAYFADYNVTTNELSKILGELTQPEKWSVANVPVATLFEDGKKKWQEDSENNVQDRLNSAAYQMLGTYGIFEESNRYGADFSHKVEPGWLRDLEQMKEDLAQLIKID
ncbi:hypothetical protein V1517DRAFT_323962 [Lipomyces orientalis]|uniref:Uncharacterized protein n=1 Tax=Lipomyces orientalis TaxID=1233043 RepID=A0ACC3TM94_9ASCO